MSTLKEAIRRSRLKNQGNSEDIRAFVAEAASTRSEELFNELMDTVYEMALEHLREVASTIKKGDKGDSVKGDKGEPGKNGIGVKGDKGDPGDDGIGKPGPKGDPGKNGTEIKRSQVLSKINEKPNGVKMASVSGLDAYLKNLQRAIREKGGKKHGGGGGGGMGNWVHETFSVSSVTTAVTTNARAAANGMAHILRYNGQVLAYGSQYTVSAKVYTFSFTLDDSSTVDISYVRT